MTPEGVIAELRADHPRYPINRVAADLIAAQAATIARVQNLCLMFSTDDIRSYDSAFTAAGEILSALGGGHSDENRATR